MSNRSPVRCFGAAAKMIDAMRAQESTRKDDKAASRLATQAGDGRFDLYVAMNGRNDWQDPERPGRRLK
jgi:hypothetical protein